MSLSRKIAIANTLASIVITLGGIGVARRTLHKAGEYTRVANQLRKLEEKMQTERAYLEKPLTTEQIIGYIEKGKVDESVRTNIEESRERLTKLTEEYAQLQQDTGIADSSRAQQYTKEVITYTAGAGLIALVGMGSTLYGIDSMTESLRERRRRRSPPHPPQRLAP